MTTRSSAAAGTRWRRVLRHRDGSTIRRSAMGDTRRYAERMNLIDMVPRGDLTSTGYALVNPGQEYLVLQPNETNDAFEVRLAAGSYDVEWCSVKTRETKQASRVSVERDGSVRFTAPFRGARPFSLVPEGDLTGSSSWRRRVG